MNEINDICIIVNPKHAKFYRRILFFEDLGVEKNYPRVEAPAIALRLNIDRNKEKLRSAYSGYSDDYNLYRFFYKNRDLSS